MGVLLIHLNERVSVDTLVDAMWGEDVPDGAEATLNSHLYRLRKVLEPDRVRGGRLTTIVQDAGGYRLVAPPGAVDSARFEELAGDARSLASDGDVARALSRCDEALAMWRGSPWAPHSDEEWAGPAAGRLEELRSQVRERRVDCLIRTGQAEVALADCDVLVAEFPLRERGWGLRMLAQYRLGRTEEALTTFSTARTSLLEELGVDPGPELQELHQRVLEADPTLAGVGVVTEPPVVVPARGEVHLPRPRGPLFGREDDLSQLRNLVLNQPVTTVVGPAGGGKSRLVVEAARGLSGEFPDGVWFVDCTDLVGRGEVVAAVCGAVGLEGVEERSADEVLLTYLRDRRLLLVIDAAHHAVEAVADVLGGLTWADHEAAFLVASREPLGIEGELVRPLSPLPFPGIHEDDTTSRPDELRDQAAVQLFTARAAAVGAVLDPSEVATVAEICAAVDGLPLAIELAAGQSRSFALNEILDHVTQDASALRAMGRRTLSLADVVQQSVDLLSPTELLVHQAASVVPGSFTPAVLASVTGLPATQTRDALAGLVHRSLLVPLGPEAPGRPSRFMQLAPMRSHARASVDRSQLRTWADRRNAWVRALAAETPRHGAPEEPAHGRRVDDDLPSVRATLHDCLVEHPSSHGAAVAARLGLYWFYRGLVLEWQRWTRLAVECEPAEEFDRILAGLSFGCAALLAGRGDVAGRYLDAVPAEGTSWNPEQSVLLGEFQFAVANAARAARDLDLAHRAAGAVRELADGTDDDSLGLLSATATLAGEALSADPLRCLATAEHVFERAVDGGNHYAAWSIANVATMAALRGGEATVGLQWSDRTLASFLEVGGRVAAGPLTLRGSLLALAGKDFEAARTLAAARAQARRAGLRWPRTPSTWDVVTHVDASLGPDERDRATREGSRLTLRDLAPGGADAL
jgi:predicted ATPase/DNA-binding SARP family transcriptional activator